MLLRQKKKPSGKFRGRVDSERVHYISSLPTSAWRMIATPAVGEILTIRSTLIVFPRFLEFEKFPCSPTVNDGILS